jgi:MFS family permease
MLSYLPIWFQAIKGNSAVQSGIRTIPLVLALVVGTIGAGQFTGRIGYYTPFLYASAVVMPIGCGLITTFKVDTGEGVWIGFQVLVGIGIGMGMQQSALAAQTVLSKKDVPTGVSLMFFTQMLAGAIFISVGQNVFDSKLVSGLVALIHGLSPHDIANTGATDLRKVVPASQLPQVLEVYNSAVRQSFIVATAIGSLCIFGALLVEWRSVKGKAGPEGGKHASAKKSEVPDSPEVKA